MLKQLLISGIVILICFVSANDLLETIFFQQQIEKEKIFNLMMSENTSANILLLKQQRAAQLRQTEGYFNDAQVRLEAMIPSGVIGEENQSKIDELKVSLYKVSLECLQHQREQHDQDDLFIAELAHEQGFDLFAFFKGDKKSRIHNYLSRQTAEQLSFFKNKARDKIYIQVYPVTQSVVAE